VGFFALLAALAGCGDACEQACFSVGTRLKECINQTWSVEWEDLGAAGPRRFRQQCVDDWQQESTDLEGRELTQALESCRQVDAEVADMKCAELRAIYVDP